MATLYTRTIGSVTYNGETITLKLVCTYTQATSDNASNVSIYVRAESGNIFNKIVSWQITGNGPTGSGGETTSSKATRNMTTKTKKISHLSNGTQTFSSGAKVTLQYMTGGGWASKDFTLSNASYALPTINVYSSLSFSSNPATMGTAVTINITRPSTSAFTATGVKITVTDNVSGIIDDVLYEGTAASYTWNLYAGYPANSGINELAVKVQSIRGGVYYTAREYTFKAIVPGSVHPTMQQAPTITDEYGWPQKIKGYSHLTITVNNAAPGSGATIVSYSLEVRNNTATGTLIYSETKFTSSTSVTFTPPDPVQATKTYLIITVTDSRGATVQSPYQVTAANYTLPQISLTAQRCNSDGTANPKGAYAKVVCDWSITQISTYNQVQGTINIWKSTDGGSTYSSIKSQTVAANTYSGTFNVVTSQATNTQALYYAEIYDALSGRIISSTKIVPKSSIPLTTYDNGTNVGVGVGVEVSGAGMEVGLEATHTQRILTSFKSSVAMGSYQAAATTITNLCNEIRFSSGCVGSVNITTALTYNNVTIPVSWYNFMYAPHRSGGVNGSASGDNCNYGTLLLMGMTGNDLIFKIRISGSSPYYNSIQRLKFWNTTRTDTYYLSGVSAVARSSSVMRLQVPVPSGYTTATATIGNQCQYSDGSTLISATPTAISVIDISPAAITIELTFTGLTSSKIYVFRSGTVNLTLS